MNERIQALADEAEDYADSVVDLGGEFHLAYTQKLAELIVRECADRATWAQDMNEKDIGAEVLKHFGVEE